MGPTDPPRRGQGEHVCGLDIGDVNEVPTLPVVLEDALWNARRCGRYGWSRTAGAVENQICPDPQ